MTISDWWNTTANAVSDGLNGIAKYVPDVIGALIVIIIGIIIAWIVKWVIVEILTAVRLDRYFDNAGGKKVFPYNIHIVNLLGDIAKWFVIFVFLVASLRILGIGSVNLAVSHVVGYIPNVLLAAVTLLVGVVVGDLLARTVLGVSQSMESRRTMVLADVARFSVVTLAVFAALGQLGLSAAVITWVIIALISMLALAGAIAFGLGAQGAARDVTERLRGSMNDEKRK